MDKDGEFISEPEIEADARIARWMATRFTGVECELATVLMNIFPELIPLGGNPAHIAARLAHDLHTLEILEILLRRLRAQRAAVEILLTDDSDA
jgi:hypothetical protein